MNIRKTIAVAVSSVALSAGMAVPAYAALSTTYVSGGTWVHGSSSGNIVSNFYHGRRYHSSSVSIGAGAGTTYRSGCTRPGAWARASHDDSIWADEAHYNFCD